MYFINVLVGTLAAIAAAIPVVVSPYLPQPPAQALKDGMPTEGLNFKANNGDELRIQPRNKTAVDILDLDDQDAGGPSAALGTTQTHLRKKNTYGLLTIVARATKSGGSSKSGQKSGNQKSGQKSGTTTKTGSGNTKQGTSQNQRTGAQKKPTSTQKQPTGGQKPRTGTQNSGNPKSGEKVKPTASKPKKGEDQEEDQEEEEEEEQEEYQEEDQVEE
ncbi:hypothetical protein CTA1_7170 [Colletotrichum tanaceti]|uniref:Uncharacterized protein n=1 Tax=Colletotrichum tanaceti TaxID=1306861 RepID=A0A4U6X189_9PEZI|nr:hypothetical protein CTA1_7170 [Colletotrichum tanaceti]